MISRILYLLSCSNDSIKLLRLCFESNTLIADFSELSIQNLDFCDLILNLLLELALLYTDLILSLLSLSCSLSFCESSITKRLISILYSLLILCFFSLSFLADCNGLLCKRTESIKCLLSLIDSVLVTGSLCILKSLLLHL